MKTDYLIMTASVGAGHIKAAEAIARELRQQKPGAEIRIVDFMASEVSGLHWLMKKIYLFMLHFVPNLYDRCYRFAGGDTSGTLTHNLLALLMYRTMARILDECEPSVVICTHPFPEGACSLIKRFSHRQFRLAAVLTDYSLHQIWIYPRVDDYFVAIEPMRQGLLKKGFSSAQVHVVGIPVNREILKLPDKAGARAQLGLNLGRPVVMLMGGGLGLGGIEEMLDELETLERPLTLLVVAGRNEELELRLRSRIPTSRHELHVWGFTQRARLLMDASDLLVTKPGALTISEAFLLNIPTVLHDPIPGPEEQNAVYATQNGASVWVHPGESLGAAVSRLLSDKEKLSSMQRGARSLARPDAALDICKALLTAD